MIISNSAGCIWRLPNQRAAAWDPFLDSPRQSRAPHFVPQCGASYDNIVFDRRATTEYTGQFGVLDLMAEFALNEDVTPAVSDHMPVWAAFRAVESGGQVETAERTTEPVRR